ncbi:unnamed protein product [Protopolystoma xenopodis]|uniref:Uncharacterized protein n=1 Tax=Protopolystoma xenopodis TaxID=117903 RepID=A0A448X0E9_9PLAT|nr:unnamed protein product [Protopolystoma xenopodis]
MTGSVHDTGHLVAYSQFEDSREKKRSCKLNRRSCKFIWCLLRHLLGTEKRGGDFDECLSSCRRQQRLLFRSPSSCGALSAHQPVVDSITSLKPSSTARPLCSTCSRLIFPVAHAFTSRCRTSLPHFTVPLRAVWTIHSHLCFMNVLFYTLNMHTKMLLHFAHLHLAWFAKATGDHCGRQHLGARMRRDPPSLSISCVFCSLKRSP